MDGIVVHDHGLKQEGAVTLQRLLIVIECVRPEIRYVPVGYFFLYTNFYFGGKDADKVN